MLIIYYCTDKFFDHHRSAVTVEPSEGVTVVGKGCKAGVGVVDSGWREERIKRKKIATRASSLRDAVQSLTLRYLLFYRGGVSREGRSREE